MLDINLKHHFVQLAGIVPRGDRTATDRPEQGWHAARATAPDTSACVAAPAPRPARCSLQRQHQQPHHYFATQYKRCTRRTLDLPPAETSLLRQSTPRPVRCTAECPGRCATGRGNARVKKILPLGRPATRVEGKLSLRFLFFFPNFSILSEKIEQCTSTYQCRAHDASRSCRFCFFCGAHCHHHSRCSCKFIHCESVRKNSS